MGGITFYTHPNSRGRIVRWMLEELGEPYETRVLTYGPAMKTPEYLAINPMGKVPAIVHGDTVVSECAAICAYLADAFPDKGLAPPLGERGAYYRALFFGAGPVEAAVTATDLKIEVPAQKVGSVGYGSPELTFATIERMVEQRPYVAGDSFTAADVYFGAQVIWGLMFKLMPARPALEAYAARLTAREAYRRASELDDAAAAALDAERG
ncbi:MAG: glutathione S-transferase family protein [Pseudomonadota bacterium]